MPSLKIFGRFLRSNPFGQDDLHYLCVGLGVFRILQLMVVVPLWIFLHMNKWQRRSNDEGTPDWCGTSQRFLSSNDTGSLALIEAGNSGSKNGPAYLTAYISVSFFYSVTDLAVLAAIWSAASVGTPTDPMGRELFLKPLFRFKIIILNMVLATLVTLGILMVHYNRLDNYGCDIVSDEEGEIVHLEHTVWYIWFCIMLVLQAFELLIWPCIIMNKVSRYIQNHQALDDDRKRISRREQCMGACLTCLGALSCFKSGGHSVAKKGGFTDATKAMMDFMHTGGTLDIVFSDIYVAFKMLVRVQRERLYNFINQEVSEDLEIGSGDDTDCIGVGTWSSHEDEGDTNDAPKRAFVKVDTLNTCSSDIVLCETSRDVLSDESERMLLSEAKMYAAHSNAIYGVLQSFLREKQLLPKGSDVFFTTEQGVALDEIGFDDTVLVYAQYRQSGIDETPYAILVDNKCKTVAISIRGSATLEDMVVDLQLSPRSIEAIGTQCGFDGGNQFAHKGVLSRANWIYEDINRYRLLDTMLLGEEPTCPGFNLVITGHSLGAGCSALLSLMLRDKFPSLKCFAFCPPGGLITERLALECSDYVTSFINSADIVPRMSMENMERLRDEALEVLARIKVSKRKLLQILSKPCDDEDLNYVNSLLLHKKEDIPKTTKYYSQLQEFKRVTAERKEVSDAHYIPLYPPGRIVYFAKAKRGYIPQFSDTKDFNEILLTPTMKQDHSIVSVMENLDCILNDFEDPCKEKFDEEEEDVQKPSSPSGRSSAAERNLNTSILEAPTFVCCSRPHGNVVFFLGLLGVIALVLSFMANNHCGFISRQTVVSEEDADTGDILSYNGIGVSTGLWMFLEKVYSGTGPENDPASYINGDKCRAFPTTFAPDSYLTAARVCGTAAQLLGVAATIAIWFASCVSYRRTTWHCITVGLLLATTLMGLTFLILQSDLCHTLHLDAFWDEPAITIESQCEIAWGGAMNLAAILAYFFLAVCTVHYPPPKTAEERMLQWLGEREK